MGCQRHGRRRTAAYEPLDLGVGREARGVEGVHPHEHDEQYHAHRVQIGCVRHGMARPEPFGAPVGLRPQRRHHAVVRRGRRRCAISPPMRSVVPPPPPRRTVPLVDDGAAKVDDLHGLGALRHRAEQDVLRLQVRVDDADVVEECQRRQYLRD